MTRAPALRIAVAGAGMVSRHHLLAWSRVPGAEVVAIADPERARAEARAAEFGLAAAYADTEAMLAEVSPDALDVAAPARQHAALCRIAASAGVAILCQKPLCPTLREAEALVSEIGTTVPFMVHENWRFRLPYRHALMLLRAGAVGPLASARLCFASGGLLGARPALARQPFLATLPRLIVLELLIHHLDVLRCLLGPLAVRGAALACVAGATRAEDTATILLADRLGVPVLCTGTMAAWGAPPIGHDELEVRGTEGVIRFDGARLWCEGRHEASLAWDEGAIYQSGYDACIAHFAEGLRTGMPFETAAVANLETLRLVEDAYSAAAAIPSTRP